MNHALSLIKAALEQVNGDPPVLRVHEETLTLVFKGTLVQAAAVKSVMDALQPEGPDLNVELHRLSAEYSHRLDAEKEKSEMRAQEMSQQMARMQKMLELRDKEMLDRVGEAERYKVRLEMTEAKAKELDQALAKKTAEAVGMDASIINFMHERDALSKKYESLQWERDALNKKVESLQRSKPGPDGSK